MVCIYRLENSLNNEDFDLSAHKKINFLIELRIERCYLFLNRFERKNHKRTNLGKFKIFENLIIKKYLSFYEKRRMGQTNYLEISLIYR